MQPYEISFARLFGPDYYAFGFWKARVALYAVLKALDLNGDDEVILPGYTCVVVPNSVRYAGAKPVYADISEGDYNLDPTSALNRFSHKTRALIAQHTYGIPADMDSFRRLARDKKLFLIEDCAHVLVGSMHRGKPLGSFGDAAFFSFQWSKPYTTGLGGMAITRNPQFARKLEDIQREFQWPGRVKTLQLQVQYSLFRRFFTPTVYWRSQAILQLLSRIGLFVGSLNSGEIVGQK